MKPLAFLEASIQKPSVNWGVRANVNITPTGLSSGKHPGKEFLNETTGFSSGKHPKTQCELGCRGECLHYSTGFSSGKQSKNQCDFQCKSEECLHCPTGHSSGNYIAQTGQLQLNTVNVSEKGGSEINPELLSKNNLIPQDCLSSSSSSSSLPYLNQEIEDNEVF